MNTISDTIMQRVKRRGRGNLFTSKDFLDLGTRTAIDKALSRLAANGVLRRLARGLYDYPKKHKLLGSLWPNINDIAKTIANDSNSQLQLTGAQAIYSLGLTTQMPTQAVFLTNGHSRKIKIGNTHLQLQHAKPAIMAGANQKVGLILQAIRYLGQNGLQDDKLQKLSSILTHQDKRELKRLARFAPTWSHSVIHKLTV